MAIRSFIIVLVLTTFVSCDSYDYENDYDGEYDFNPADYRDYGSLTNNITRKGPQLVCGILFLNPNFAGKDYEILDGTEIRNLQKIKKTYDNAFSSLKVTPGCTLTLYDKFAFKEELYSFTTELTYISSIFDNKASSLKCYCTLPKIWHGNKKIAIFSITGMNKDKSHMAKNMFDGKRASSWESRPNLDSEKRGSKILDKKVSINFTEEIELYALKIRTAPDNKKSYTNICLYVDNVQITCGTTNNGQAAKAIMIWEASPNTIGNNIELRFLDGQDAKIAELWIEYDPIIAPTTAPIIPTITTTKQPTTTTSRFWGEYWSGDDSVAEWKTEYARLIRTGKGVEYYKDTTSSSVNGNTPSAMFDHSHKTYFQSADPLTFKKGGITVEYRRWVEIFFYEEIKLNSLRIKTINDPAFVNNYKYLRLSTIDSRPKSGFVWGPPVKDTKYKPTSYNPEILGYPAKKTRPAEVYSWSPERGGAITNSIRLETYQPNSINTESFEIAIADLWVEYETVEPYCKKAWRGGGCINIEHVYIHNTTTSSTTGKIFTFTIEQCYHQCAYIEDCQGFLRSGKAWYLLFDLLIKYAHYPCELML